MPEWVYALIAVLPITAFWTAYQIFKAFEKREKRIKRNKSDDLS